MKLITLTLFLLAALGLSAQDKLIKEDSCLRKLSMVLPANWQISMADNWIVIQNRDTTKAGKTESKRGPVSFMFRYEPKWTAEKYRQIKSYNEQLGYAIAELENKYNLKEVIKRSTSSGILVGNNEEENKRIIAYNQEKSQLQKQIVALPVFNSENYSLFDTFFNERISSEYYYPQAAGNEMINVHASIRGALLPAN